MRDFMNMSIICVHVCCYHKKSKPTQIEKLFVVFTVFDFSIIWYVTNHHA